jgi:hypothetical protein
VRNAMRRMIQLTLGELKTKLQFVLDNPENAKAVAHISSSSSGRRELPPLEEPTLADEQVYDAREREAMKWMD